MKKYISILLTIFLIPIFVNAETLTYDVCESGCEYASLGDVRTAIRNLSDLSDKDIVINVNRDIDNYFEVGSIDNMANSVTINGNGYTVNSLIEAYTDIVTVNNLKTNNDGEMDIFNAQKIIINNSDIKRLWIAYRDSSSKPSIEEVNLNDILEIDQNSLNNLNAFALLGNIIIENMDFSKQVLMLTGGTINIYNSNINKVTSVPIYESVTINIYNSNFNDLKYVNIPSTDSTEWNEILQLINLKFDISVLSHDIYDVNATDFIEQYKSTTMIYFDKETKLKPSDKLNLAKYLDYYTEDKEIEYTIEDESIAKIENKELIAIKEGSTKVTVTTDDGHVVYRINLVVEKETISEKIDKMTIKVPITGSKVKAWVVVISVILLGVIGVCSYMLIKRKK